MGVDGHWSVVAVMWVVLGVLYHGIGGVWGDSRIIYFVTSLEAIGLGTGGSILGVGGFGDSGGAGGAGGGGEVGLEAAACRRRFLTFVLPLHRLGDLLHYTP